MKNRKLNFLFMVIFFLVLIATIINNDTTTKKEHNNLNSDHPSDIITSESWNLTAVDYIFIDDSITEYNWSTYNATHNWCTGAGTWEDPYIIENVTLNMEGTGSAIEIVNSNVYFIIRNCTIRNTGSDNEDAGIKLINVNNSRLIGNKFLDINQIGIYLKDTCTNNTISDNYLFENNPDEWPYIMYGIYLNNQCSNNTINNNEIHRINQFVSSNRGGIQLDGDCNYNKIENNLINQSKHGIYLTNNCNENILSNNSIMNNTGNGIYITTNCDYQTISNNTIDFNNIGIMAYGDYQIIYNNTLLNNSEYGISISYSRYSNVWENELNGCGFRIVSTNIIDYRELSLSENNTVNGKPVYYCVEESGLDSSYFPNAGQIILIDCNHTKLENFDFSFCSIGIYISKVADGGYNHTISNITLQGNTIGLYSINSYDIRISNITAKTNGKGLFLVSSYDCTINNCTLNENTESGLEMYDCNSNNITNNYIQYNNIYGLFLSECEYNNIVNNTMSNTEGHGIFFNLNSYFNIILNNTISNNNENGIYLYYNCDKNNITLNQIYYNGENGIYLNDNCNSNNISLNCISHSEANGIYIYSSSTLNVISNNTVYNNSENGIYIRSNLGKNNITGNIIENKNYGIIIQDSLNIFMTENDLNLCGVFLSGTYSQIKSHQIDITNQVNQKTLYYYLDQNGLETSSFSDAGQIILINCNDTLISKVNVSYGSVGISLYKCYNVTIQEINSTNNQVYGIYLKDSHNSTLVSNNLNYNIENGIYLEDSYYINITRNQVEYNLQNGIYLNGDYMSSSISSIAIERNNISRNYNNGLHIYSASNINISDNIIENNKNHGIYLNSSCEYITIYNNNISFNDIHGISLYSMLSDINKMVNITQNRIYNNSQNGIYFQSACNSSIIGNLIANNSVKGLRLQQYSGGNLIYNNYFINNGENAVDNLYILNSDPNSWDNGSLGNYWDDYPGGDNNGNGIGDTPYYIPGTAGARDNYPIWGIPLPEGPSSEGKDKKSPSKIDLTPYLLGGIIIGSIVAAYYGLHVYSKKYPLRKSALKEEPLLEKLPDEKDTLKTRKTLSKSPETREISTKKQPEVRKIIDIDHFDQFSIEEKFDIKSKNIDDIYNDLLKKHPTISKYLDSDLSINEIPGGDKLIATIIDEEDLRKIDLINLPEQDKKVFMMEILSMNAKDRKRLLNEMLRNLE